MAKVVAPAQNLSRLLASMSWSALLPGVRLFIFIFCYNTLKAHRVIQRRRTDKHNMRNKHKNRYKYPHGLLASK